MSARFSERVAGELFDWNELEVFVEFDWIDGQCHEIHGVWINDDFDIMPLMNDGHIESLTNVIDKEYEQ